MRIPALLSFLAVVMGACTTLRTEEASDYAAMAAWADGSVVSGGEAPAVAARGRDAADDPAIWVHPQNPSRGVVIGTDKKAGLFVYDLAGRQLQFLQAGRLNNVDVRGQFPIHGVERVLVAASDSGRPGAGATLFLLDPATLNLELWAAVPVDLDEPYGVCLARRGAAFLMIVHGTDGQVRQLRVAAGPDGQPLLAEERRFAVATHPEGCVADDRRGQLYLGEEGRGVWRFDLGAGKAEGELIAEAPSQALMPDVEGLALMEDGAGTWLIASSQGDSAFAVWNVGETQTVYHGRYSVVAGNGFDAVNGTDGVAAEGRLVGAFPAGLVVAQDDERESWPFRRQTFKLVAWSDVKFALGLPEE